jgi:Cys-rich repeat protein
MNKEMFKIKLFILISFSIFGAMIFISCSSDCNGIFVEGTCIKEIPCKTDSDCGENRYCEENAYCRTNHCITGKIDCVAGTCTPGDNPDTEDEIEAYYCKCGDDSLPYEMKYSGKLVCTPKCKAHSDCPRVASACFRGQCVDYYICTQDSDCPEGESCYRHACYKMNDEN